MDTGKTDRYFFTGFGIWFVMANALGFGASIYYYPDPNGLPFYVSVHGLTFGVWILLYAIQAGLITVDKRKLHAILGKTAAIVCLVIAVAGLYTFFMKIPKNNNPPHEVGRDIVALIVFLVLVTLGVRNRNSPFAHKRYMLIATMVLSSAGVARIPIWFEVEPSFIVLLLMIFLPAIALISYDYFTRKKWYKLDFGLFLIVLAVMMISSTPAVWENDTWSGFVYGITQHLSYP